MTCNKSASFRFFWYHSPKYVSKFVGLLPFGIRHFWVRPNFRHVGNKTVLFGCWRQIRHLWAPSFLKCACAKCNVHFTTLLSPPPRPPFQPTPSPHSLSLIFQTIAKCRKFGCTVLFPYNTLTVDNVAVSYDTCYLLSGRSLYVSYAKRRFPPFFSSLVYAHIRSDYWFAWWWK